MGIETKLRQWQKLQAGFFLLTPFLPVARIPETGLYPVYYLDVQFFMVYVLGLVLSFFLLLGMDERDSIFSFSSLILLIIVAYHILEKLYGFGGVLYCICDTFHLSIGFLSFLGSFISGLYVSYLRVIPSIHSSQSFMENYS